MVQVDELRIVGNFHRFGKTCIAHAHLAVVRRLREVAIGITYFGSEYSAYLLEEVFSALKAASCKINISSIGVILFFHLGVEVLVVS